MDIQTKTAVTIFIVVAHEIVLLFLIQTGKRSIEILHEEIKKYEDNMSITMALHRQNQIRKISDIEAQVATLKVFACLLLLPIVLMIIRLGF